MRILEQFDAVNYSWRIDIVQNLYKLWELFLRDFLGPKLPNTLSPKYPRGQNVLIPPSCIHPSVTSVLYLFLLRSCCAKLFVHFVLIKMIVVTVFLYELNIQLFYCLYNFPITSCWNKNAFWFYAFYSLIITRGLLINFRRSLSSITFVILDISCER